MKKKITSTAIILTFFVTILIGLTGCTKKNTLDGKWSDAKDDMYNAEWTFTEETKEVKMKSKYTEGKGTYTLKDENKVTIDLDIWTNPIEYEYSFNDEGKLTLKATNGYSPNYIDLTKSKEK